MESFDDDDDAMGHEMEKIEHYRSAYFTILARCSVAEQETSNIPSRAGQTTISVNLPSLKLIMFNGDPSQWLQFIYFCFFEL